MRGIVRSFKRSLKKIVATPILGQRQTKTFQTVIARDKSKQSFYKIRRYYGARVLNESRF